MTYFHRPGGGGHGTLGPTLDPLLSSVRIFCQTVIELYKFLIRLKRNIFVLINTHHVVAVRAVVAVIAVIAVVPVVPVVVRRRVSMIHGVRCHRHFFFNSGNLKFNHQIF